MMPVRHGLLSRLTDPKSVTVQDPPDSQFKPSDTLFRSGIFAYKRPVAKRVLGPNSITTPVRSSADPL